MHCSTLDAKESEERFLRRLFKINGYPNKFIVSCTRSQPLPEPRSSANIWISLQYTHRLSEVAARLLTPLNIGVAHRPISTIKSVVMHPKDTIEDDKKTNVIYGIPCSEYPSVYVRQTGRMLKTMMAEHRAAVRRLDSNSQIDEHVNETGHRFNFSEATILSHAENDSERLFKEAWLSDDKSINRHIDLHPDYLAMCYQLARRRDRITGRRSINLS